MNADVTAAFRHGGWTFYGKLGRQPRGDDPRVASFEHWFSYQSEKFGVRAGRFLPAYGVKLPDQHELHARPLGFDNEDQVYAVEGGCRDDRQLIQVSVGPGRADDIDESDLAFTASARCHQYTLTPRTVVVASGIVRDSTALEPSNGSTSLAFGFSPLPRLTLWTPGDVQFRSGEFKTTPTRRSCTRPTRSSAGCGSRSSRSFRPPTATARAACAGSAWASTGSRARTGTSS